MRLKIAAAMAAMVFSLTAHAGPNADALGKCMADSATQTDREVLDRWFFVAAAANPAVASMSKVTQEDTDKANAATGALVTKLLTTTCKEKAQKVLATEGVGGVQGSFRVLFDSVATEMFGNPAVMKVLSGSEKYLDGSKLLALMLP